MLDIKKLTEEGKNLLFQEISDYYWSEIECKVNGIMNDKRSINYINNKFNTNLTEDELLEIVLNY